MIVRTTTFQLRPDQLDEAAQWFEGRISQARADMEGLHAIYFCVDREQGTLKGIGLWESREAIENGDRVIAGLRSEGAQAFETGSPTIEVFDVVAQI